MCKTKVKTSIFKTVFVIFSVFSALCMILIGYLNFALPSSISVVSGETVKFASNLPVEAVFEGDSTSSANITKSLEKSYNVKLKAFGLFPIKTAGVSVVDNTNVLVLGMPFGTKIYTEGVMVVGIDTVATENGIVSPGESAGLKKGDTILTIDNKKVFSNENVAEIIENSSGNDIEFKILRNKKQLKLYVKPALCYQSGKYKTGIWVRDSGAGIGTLSFYCPNNKIICGLGHGVCDADTGQVLPLNSGELVGAEILAVEKGSAGNPGELVGRFTDKKLGDLVLNNDTGVYGNCLINYDNSKLMKIALKQEVVTGNAKIYTTVEGSKPQYYDCKIEKISHGNSVTKNMVVKITDKRLINKTGGIVQGMSGSPIIQNGKLIGAVTHVLVDDPTKGYAIFVENMLETAQGVANEQLKEAS